MGSTSHQRPQPWEYLAAILAFQCGLALLESSPHGEVPDLHVAEVMCEVVDRMQGIQPVQAAQCASLSAAGSRGHPRGSTNITSGIVGGGRSL